MTFDLFTSLGTPWARFFLKLRRRNPRLDRVGDLVTCSAFGCRRTFVRTESDPRVKQSCPVCRHDVLEGYQTVQVRPTRVVSFHRLRPAAKGRS